MFRICIPEYFGVNDHPVCGNKVGFAAVLINAAATPPVSGGELLAPISVGQHAHKARAWGHPNCFADQTPATDSPLCYNVLHEGKHCRRARASAESQCLPA
jgi:hypothetical protein